ncbi:Ig-like domain-containing protein [Curtobacterium sp. 9128]|uniref:beta strand repeat-containing protein n=1 Tax=Curtobacterium sp. 9128 TaxID=1793722 RepID=UPI002481C902|nr:Ig-like domain-containing protein [Curtobacterium sp. 9128]
MRHPQDTRVPRARQGLRLIAMLGATLLVGAGITATTAALTAAPASAVTATSNGAFICDQNTVYAIDSTGKVLAVDVTNTASAGTTADVTTLGTDANNGLGISREGLKMYATSNGQNNTLKEYVPAKADGTAAVTKTIQTDSTRNILRGAVDPTTGIYYYGSDTGWLGAYDPNTGKNIGQVGQIPIDQTGGIKSGNGDFAFSSRGQMFVVAADKIYRVNVPKLPTTAGAPTINATEIATLPSGTNSPGIAFSSDGYLYVSNSPSNTSTVLYQLDPTTGQSLRNFSVNASFRASDLATCNYADTVTGASSVDDRWNSGDQFGLAVTGGGISSTNSGTTATTSGSKNGVQDQQAGAVLTTPGKDYTVTQTAAGTTNLANYATTWRAVNVNSGAEVAKGTGNTATFTFPAATSSDGTDVVVTFANVLQRVHVATAADTYSTPVDTKLDVAAPGVLANDTGDGLSVTSHTDPANGTLTMTAKDGSFSYVPNNGFSGTDQFTYTATDGGGRTSTSTVTITVAPKAVDDAFSVHAGSTATTTTKQTGVLGNDRGTGLTVTNHTDPTNGTLTLNTDGTYSYTPKVGFSGGDSFTYTAKDTAGSTITGTVTITVLPTAKTETITATSGSSTSATAPGLLGNDLGSDLVVTGNTKPAHGDVTVNPDGSYTYTPTTGYSGQDSFDYTVTDGNGAGKSDTVTVTVTVLPKAVDDTITIGAGSTATTTTRETGLLGNDLGTGLTITSTTAPTNGTLTVDKATGTYSYTPNDGFSGSDSFTYTATDKAGNLTTATVRITVTPTVTDDTATTPANTPLTVDVQHNDHGKDLATSVVTTPTNGTAVAQPDGTVQYTPKDGFSGTDTFTYTVTDGPGRTTQPATVTVSVTPVANPDTASTTAGATLTIPAGDLTRNDVGTTLQVTGATSTKNGDASVDQATGALTYTPKDGFSGTDTVTYEVTDASGQKSTGVVTIVVGPTAAPDTATATAGETLTVSKDDGVLANDKGTGKQAAVDQKPTNGDLDLATDGSYTYTPHDGFSGTDTFTYTLTDGSGRTSTGTVTITVDPGTEKDAISTKAGQPVSVTSGELTKNDHGDGLQVIGAQGAANGDLSVADDGTVTYTPHSGFSGTDTFTYTVIDAHGNKGTGTVTVTVTPVVAASTGSATTDEPVTVSDEDGVLKDSDGTGLEVTDNTQPEHGAATVGEKGGYTYTPKPGYSGPDSFDYTVTDQDGNTTTGTVTITVLPKGVADTGSTPASTPVDVPVTKNDSGTTLTVATVTNGTNGTVGITGPGTVTYTPKDGFSGTDTFTYTAKDSTGGSTQPTTVTVTVSPTAKQDLVTTPAGTPLPIASTTLTANDNGSGLTVTGHGDAAHGDVTTGTDGGLVYTPAPGFSGTDEFTYTATDSSGQTTTSTVIVIVGAVAMPDSGTTTTNGTLTVTTANGVLGNDLGTGLTATLDRKPTHGDVELGAKGGYTYTPKKDWSGTDTFTYTATDTDGNTATGVVTITVTPTAGDDKTSTPAGKTVTVTGPGVLGNDHGTKLTVVGSGTPEHGTVTIAADGTFVYTPAAGFSGTDHVTYTVQDASGQRTSATVTITVGIMAKDGKATTIAGTAVGRDGAHGVLAGSDGVALWAKIDRKPAHGTVTLQKDGAWIYTPAAGFTGVDSFTAIVTDESGQTTTVTTTITVLAHAVATDDKATGTANQPVTIDPLTNDKPTSGATFDRGSLHLVDPKGALVDSITVDGKGTWTIRDGKVVFTPVDGFTGTVQVGYSIVDSDGQQVLATITVVYPVGLAAKVHAAELAFTGTTGLVGLSLAALTLLLAGVLLIVRRRIRGTD